MPTIRMSPLIEWVFVPDDIHGIRFARASDAWEFWNYAQLAQRTCAIATALRDVKVRNGDVIAIAAPSGPSFVCGFFGALLCGATPAPIASPALFENSAAYQDLLTGSLQTARPSVVLTDGPEHDVIERSARAAGVKHVLALDGPLPDAADADDTCTVPRVGLLQFTSGSSGLRRGVRVSASALEANVDAIRRWLQWTKADAFASWLPLHHDMGLIGALVSSVVGQSDLWLLQPEQFVRRPLRYLQCFGGDGDATLSVMPNFGLDYINRRVRPDTLSECDFSRWRGLVIGAERIDAGTLARFSALLGPCGLNPLALLPAYGLAEATLAVTGLPLHEMWTSVTVDPACLSLDREIALATGATASEVVVGCGRPLGDASVAIVDRSGQHVPNGRVGEIAVRSASVADGYIDTRELASATIDDGLLMTGDAGFVLDGQLFVLGRLGDSLKVRGRIVFGEQIELALSGLGIPRERVAVLLGVHRGVPTAIVVIERHQFRSDDIHALIRLHAGAARPWILAAPAGTIARTTSGKPRRRQLWQAFVDGTLPGRLIDPQASVADPVVTD